MPVSVTGRGTVSKGDVTESGCHRGSGTTSYSSTGHQCLDVSGLDGSGPSGAGLTIFPCSLQDDHMWTF